MSEEPHAGQAPLAALRRFVRPRTVAERCDFCSAELPTDHQHLLEPARRQVLCACDECAISIGEGAGTTYRRVPRRSRSLPNFQISDGQWDELLIPVGMAFFFTSTPDGRVLALYPSPAGATESLLGLDSWQEIVRANPILATMEADVEALLVNRIRGARDYYLVPIDECYRLVGLIRTGWRGLSGGTEVWQEIDRFFSQLQARSTAAVALPGGGSADAHA